MKKIFLTLVAIIFATGIFAQTGEGWKPIRNKQNFKDSVNFVNIPTMGVMGNDTIASQAYSRLYGGGGDMSYADTATMLSKYARKLNPTFTGTVVIPSPFTLGATSVTTTGTQLNYLNTATSDIQAQLNDTLDLTTLIPFQADTTTLFAWSVGIGAAGDTANFRKYVPHAYSYGSFFWDGSDTLVITKLIAKVSSGGSLTVQVSWDVNDEDATPTVLNNSSPTITSSTAGDIDTSFDNAEIPPGRWVWLTTPTVTTQPTKLRVTLIGHKRNLTY